MVKCYAEYMKILYVIPRASQGGAQKYVLTLATEFRKRGEEVSVALGERGWLSENLEREGVPVFFLNGLKRTYNPFRILLFAYEFHHFLSCHFFDVVHFNSSNALFGVFGVSRLRQRPKLIFTLHGLSILNPGWKKFYVLQWIYAIIFRVLLRRIDTVIFVCHHDFEYAKKLKLVTEQQGLVIYNGISLSLKFLEKNEARKKLSIYTGKDFNGKIIIGTLARFDYAKNLDLLIEVAKIFPPSFSVVFVIVGEGVEKERLQQKVKKMELQESVYFCKNFPEAYRCMKAFDIFVMTSRYEGLPYALLEAMAAKVPIVATNVGGISEMIENEKSGLLVDSGDKMQLVTSLKILFEHPEQRLLFAEFGAEIVCKKFREDAMCDRTLRFYNSI